MAPAGRAAEVPAELGGESSLVTRPSWLPNKGSTPSAPRGRGQEKDGKLRKSCNCKNSRCLKLYCECFASGQYCFGCNCQACHNNPENDEMRKRAIEQTLERNPSAFRPKINHSAPGAANTDSVGRHNKGCHCKKSGCLKKYCECFQAGILCNESCKCSDCKNFEGSKDRAALLGLHPQLTSPPSAKRPKMGGAEPGSSHTPGQRAPEGGAGAAGSGQLAEPPFPQVEDVMDASLLRAREAIATAIDDEKVAAMCTRMLDRLVPTPASVAAQGARLSAADAAAAYEQQEHEVLTVLHAELCAIHASAAAASNQAHSNQAHSSTRVPAAAAAAEGHGAAATATAATATAATTATAHAAAASVPCAASASSRPANGGAAAHQARAAARAPGAATAAQTAAPRPAAFAADPAGAGPIRTCAELAEWARARAARAAAAGSAESLPAAGGDPAASGAAQDGPGPPPWVRYDAAL